MTPWFRLTLLCLALLCLLLNLTQAADCNPQLHSVGSGSGFAQGREVAPNAPTVSVVRWVNDSARAGPQQSLALDCMLTADTGPPGWESHGPSAPDWAFAKLPVNRSNGAPPELHFATNNGVRTSILKTSRFRNSL